VEIFGVDYEAEKRKQEELYAALREQRRKKGADGMLKTRGGGGKRQHSDLKKFRRFCQEILGLETQKMREEILKRALYAASDPILTDDTKKFTPKSRKFRF
jgi:hypothetical protein